MDDAQDDIVFDPDLPISQTPSRPAATDREAALSPLEQEVLDEYAKLVGNLDDLASVFGALASKPSAELADGLRGLERKTATVLTLLKASVYSIVLAQGMEGEGS